MGSGVMQIEVESIFRSRFIGILDLSGTTENTQSNSVNRGTIDDVGSLVSQSSKCNTYPYMDIKP